MRRRDCLQTVSSFNYYKRLFAKVQAVFFLPFHTLKNHSIPCESNIFSNLIRVWDMEHPLGGRSTPRGVPKIYETSDASKRKGLSAVATAELDPPVDFRKNRPPAPAQNPKRRRVFSISVFSKPIFFGIFGEFIHPKPVFLPIFRNSIT